MDGGGLATEERFSSRIRIHVILKVAKYTGDKSPPLKMRSSSEGSRFTGFPVEQGGLSGRCGITPVK